MPTLTMLVQPRCSFGWDNEYGSRTYSVPAFEAGKHMVSNGEFAEFVKDAGYARRELWTESGWGWKMFRNVKCPHFWVPEVRFWDCQSPDYSLVPGEGSKTSSMFLEEEW